MKLKPVLHNNCILAMLYHLSLYWCLPKMGFGQYFGCNTYAMTLTTVLSKASTKKISVSDFLDFWKYDTHLQNKVFQKITPWIKAKNTENKESVRFIAEVCPIQNDLSCKIQNTQQLEHLKQFRQLPVYKAF